jgi:hypothetical protein
VPRVRAAQTIGTLPSGNGVDAKDLAYNAVTADGVRYVFGDTLGPLNLDGTVVSMSTALARLDAPLDPVVTAPPWQPLPYTSAEATWNLAGVAVHPFRWALPPVGLVSEPGAGARLFYAVDRTAYGLRRTAFYSSFLMHALGTSAWPTGAATLARDPDEMPLADDEWASGFHRLSDGTVAFFVQDARDGERLSRFHRGTWTPDHGFAVESRVAFRLGAVLGVSVWWSAQWLCAYVDTKGVIRLNALDRRGRIRRRRSRVVQRIPHWSRPWDGYAAVHVDGADGRDGATFDLVYSRLTSPPSSGLPIVRVWVGSPAGR